MTAWSTRMERLGANDLLLAGAGVAPALGPRPRCKFSSGGGRPEAGASMQGQDSGPQHWRQVVPPGKGDRRPGAGSGLPRATFGRRPRATAGLVRPSRSARRGGGDGWNSQHGTAARGPSESCYAGLVLQWPAGRQWPTTSTGSVPWRPSDRISDPPTAPKGALAQAGNPWRAKPAGAQPSQPGASVSSGGGERERERERERENAGR